MNGNLTIRLAEAADADLIHAGLLAMARAMGEESRITSTAADILENGFGASPAFEVLIAEIGGAFAGLCLSFPSFSTWRGERGIYVQDLYVDETYRGHGIGEALLKAAARRARERGAGYLRLSVDIANAGAQAFYERVGIPHSRDEQIHMIKGEAFRAFSASETDQT
ncbi:MAG: GNAT family N-acetyltransferase [Rhizobium sp.]|nr:GNAT family N-acetyltransferase [Rhizobium sp.]